MPGDSTFVPESYGERSTALVASVDHTTTVFEDVADDVLQSSEYVAPFGETRDRQSAPHRVTTGETA